MGSPKSSGCHIVRNGRSDPAALRACGPSLDNPCGPLPLGNPSDRNACPNVHRIVRHRAGGARGRAAGDRKANASPELGVDQESSFRAALNPLFSTASARLRLSGMSALGRIPRRIGLVLLTGSLAVHDPRTTSTVKCRSVVRSVRKAAKRTPYRSHRSKTPNHANLKGQRYASLEMLAAADKSCADSLLIR
jgi:hypothetical protein